MIIVLASKSNMGMLIKLIKNTEDMSSIALTKNLIVLRNTDAQDLKTGTDQS